MALTAIPVGFVAGLFGIGGGLITVPFLYYIFGSLGIAFYLIRTDFNFGYWLFTNLLFFVMLIYSATNMYNLSYFGLFNNKFIKFNTINTRFLFVGMYVLTILNIYISKVDAIY